MKAIDQYFLVALFVMLYTVVLTFESVDKILKCNHSNERYRAVRSCGAVCCSIQGDSNIKSANESLSVTILMKARMVKVSSTFLW